MPRVVGLLCEGIDRPFGLDVATPRLSWRPDGPAPGLRQTAYRVRVASTAAAAADAWDSGRVESDRSAHVTYAGRPLEAKRRYAWDVTVWTAADGGAEEAATSAPSWFETGLPSPADRAAQWINRGGGMQSWQSPARASPLLRRAFTLPAGVRSARAYVCGLGYYDLFVNGACVGDAAGETVLKPTVTQYDRRARYVTHDVTGLLAAGGNAIGVMLGNGWYNPNTAEVWHFDKAPWRDYPKLWLRLEAALDDGSTAVVASDASWKVADGPVVFDSLRNGETYDARRERPGWATAGFDDSDWAAAAVVPGPGGGLTSQWGPPVRVADTVAAVARWSPSPGVTVFDVGQNLTGRARVRVRGAAGRTLTLRYAEALDAAAPATARDTDGRNIGGPDIDTRHVARFVTAGEFQTDRFTPAADATPAGAPVEWEPRFTYHGFRYVRASWDADAPAHAGAPALDLDARVIETDLPPAGDFACSDDVVNRIHAATRWSFRGNFTGIPTDCPHREKNGWTGDAHLAVETGLLNFRVGPAYREWVETVADAQRPSGQLPGIVPTGGWGFNWGSGPAWDAAFLVIPWQVYLHTGDDAMIRRHYPAMRRYVEFCRGMASDHVVSFGLGDWCPVDKDRVAPVPLTSTGYYHAMATLLAKFATLVGESGDAAEYDALAGDIRGAFEGAFYRGDGVYGDDGTTSLAGAVYQGLVPPARVPRVIGRLVDAVHAAGVKPDFGILGAKWVPRVLGDHGHVDLAYRLLTQREYPGWAHWTESGATTLYETWDGKASRNHIMFGDIDAWLFNYVAGLRPDPRRPGFRHAIVRPFAPAGLEHFSAWHDTPYGTLRSAWHREGEAVHFEVTVPPNSTATVTLPDGATHETTAGTRAFRVDAARAP